MRLTRVRRLVSFMAVLVLAFGIGAHGAQSMVMGGEMEPAAAGSHSVPDICYGCGDSDDAGMAMGACFALCAVTAALPVGFASTAEPIAERLGVSAERGGIDQSGPPDPYPPRSIVLS